MAPGFQWVNQVNRFRIPAILSGILMVGLVAASDSDIAERIRPVGEVCIEGEACASAAPVAVATAGGGDVHSNFNRSCATCHNAGIAGAPKFGDVDAWAPRIAKGLDTLYASTINGMPPAMPAKGMCFSCSDDDLRALVDYMVDAAR